MREQCRQGHPFPQNLRLEGINGWVRCAQCDREKNRRSYWKHVNERRTQQRERKEMAEKNGQWSKGQSRVVSWEEPGAKMEELKALYNETDDFTKKISIIRLINREEEKPMKAAAFLFRQGGKDRPFSYPMAKAAIAPYLGVDAARLLEFMESFDNAVAAIEPKREEKNGNKDLN